MSTILKIKNPLVSVNWLCQYKDATNLVVLNGTLPKVTSKNEHALSETTQIPNSLFFDIKKVFSIQDAPFPNTSLKPEKFQAKARALGIRNDSCIVVYDEHGIYSSARVWWLFKTMGFENIAVLNGGFPAWKTIGGAVEKKENKVVKAGDFTVSHKAQFLIDSEAVFNAISDTTKQIIDARSSGRFYATEPEPRSDMRGGRIPRSKSLPYPSVLNGVELKSVEELQQFFNQMNAEDKELIFSCGSGITACVLALGATIAGYKKIAVYDGSWSAWASSPNLPIET